MKRPATKRPFGRRLASAVSVLALCAGAAAAGPPDGPSNPAPAARSGAALAASPPVGPPPFHPLPLGPCEQAAAAAEAAHGLPAGLLLAIGRIEGGRRDAASGRGMPWPWTINAAGKGQWFETRDAAVQAVEAARAAGIRSIDAGCFQISLLHHPGAFADLNQAFNPGANAAYAARFLRALFARAGSWEGAVENYHSADPARGLAYRDQVFAAWFAPGSTPLATSLAAPGAAPGATTGATSGATPPMVRAGMPPGLLPMPSAAGSASASVRVTSGVRVWTPMEAGTAPTVVAMPPPLRPARLTPGGH